MGSNLAVKMSLSTLGAFVANLHTGLRAAYHDQLLAEKNFMRGLDVFIYNCACLD